jgi:hypothetical protein
VLLGSQLILIFISYTFISYSTPDEADRAIRRADGRKIFGVVLKCDHTYSNPKVSSKDER